VGKVLYLDCVAGAAGDMTVAALVHAGAPLDGILAELAGLGLTGWSAHTEAVRRGPYAATRFVVAYDPQPYRTWRSIRRMLRSSALHPRVRERALSAFGRLAEAESRVHGTPVDEVHFHEVGAVDSIVDIVGACAAMEFLDIDHIVASPLPMGQGRVHTEHGLLPIPVPATVEVLRGWPVEPSPFPGELVTPTGAALIAALATPGPMPAMRVESVGYGAGTRDPKTHANVLRAVVGEGDAGSLVTVTELRAQVDDLTGEAIPPLLDALFAAGALDAFVTPIVMKKGRPALLLTALCPPDLRAAVGEALLRHGATFGYRYETLTREVVGRRHVSVDTAFGPIRIKLAERAGSVLFASPEFEDCRAAALAAGVPVAQVFGAALAGWGRGSEGER
jgi:uncharacterized protein (TIGR00299 family) protein